jgi:DDE superfamily endonuclease
LAQERSNVQFHFTPTRASWLNQVETWFSILQRQSLSGASFTAGEQLQEHIDAFIAAYNENGEPFAWKKEKSPPAPVQRPKDHSTLIPGTSLVAP